MGQAAAVPTETAGWWRRAWDGPTGRVLRRYPGLWIVPVVMFIAASSGDAITTGPVLCVFRLSSGVPCAGCGLTRAFVALAHGHPEAALHYNLLSPIAFAWFNVWWLLAVGALLRGRLPPRHPDLLLQVTLAVLMGYWLVRAWWFVRQDGAWADMVAVSPVIRAVDALL